MPEKRDNKFRLTVVPIFVAGDQLLVVHRRTIPDKLHAWETGFLGRDLTGAQTPLQVIEDLRQELGCRKINKRTFVASHHERREYPTAKPPYTRIHLQCVFLSPAIVQRCRQREG